MQFGDVERNYQSLKTEFDAGRLSEDDFRARLAEMMIEDDQGTWWSIGYETGKWYYHDGERWVRGDPALGAPGAADKSTATRSAAAGLAGAAAATDKGASSTGASVGSSGSAPGNLAAAGALGGFAAAPAPVPSVASVANSNDASAATRAGSIAGASRATSQAAAPGQRKGALTAGIIVIVVLALAVGAYLVLSKRFMVMSTADMTSMVTPTASAGSGQAGGMATAPAAESQVSPTAELMAAMPAATATPTEMPISTVPPETSTPPAPSATLPPLTATSTASPMPDTVTPEPPTPTPLPPTPTPAATATRRPAPTPTRVPATVQPAAPSAPGVPGLVTGFEQWGKWVRGNQPYGTFNQDTQNAHGGNASARLDYNFPAVKDNYVVFSARPALPIPGNPTALSIWVLGDGSGHFLNAWIQDSQGEVRAFSFGTVPEAGTWRQLTAPLDTTAPWPQGHISGPENGKLDYPIKLFALVLDGVPDGSSSQGTIYLDDIMVAPGQ